jgi:hypothetical protein
MATFKYTPDPRVEQIFTDLENLSDFCKDYGYKYNEADLYNWKSFTFQQFSKYQQGKQPKDLWYPPQREYTSQPR